MNHVYVSYSPKDEPDAALVCQALREQGLDVWSPADSPPGRNWALEAGQALQRSDCMVVLVSPESVVSDLIRLDVQHAQASTRLRNRLFAAMIRPTFVLPWCLRTLPLFQLWEDRTRGTKRLVQAITRPRRKAAG